MAAQDSILARYQSEIEERQTFIQGLLESAEKEARDLDAKELELITRNRDRISVVNGMLEPLRETARIVQDSREASAKLQAEFAAARSPEMAQKVEYRSAGEYALDMWRSGLGNPEARNRIEMYNRAASHQTTSDNPGLIPTPILGPVVNFIDNSRPLVGYLGPRQIPSGSFSRPKVTQHTSVAAQSSEKAELVSQKMTISKLAVTPSTLGGYVNVSRQDIDWAQPAIMDIVISDLASQYAILTENTAVQAFYTGGTQGGTIPGTPTGDQVAAQFWAAAAQVYTATKGIGQTIAVASPDVLGSLGGLFQPVNPMNQQGEGFRASSFGQGVAGYIAGVPVLVTTGFGATKRLMLLSTAAAEVYEERVGALQVVEPSVLGVQVAYAGYFASLIVESTGVVKVTVT